VPYVTAADDEVAQSTGRQTTAKKVMIMSTQRIPVGGFVYEADPPKTQSPLVAFISRLKHWLAGYVRERALWRAEMELQLLDDRMLRDIGLSRSEIGSAVRNPQQERINGARLPIAGQF